MKSILTLLTLTLAFSFSAQAALTTASCKTEKGTALHLVYDAYSAQSHKAELVELTIAGEQMAHRLENGRFGTTGGSPRFGIVDFPQAGLRTDFDIYGRTYTVYKAGSFSGDVHQMTCTIEQPKKDVVDTSF